MVDDVACCDSVADYGGFTHIIVATTSCVEVMGYCICAKVGATVSNVSTVSRLLVRIRAATNQKTGFCHVI